MRRLMVFRSVVWLVLAGLVAQPWLGQWAMTVVAAELNSVVICTGAGFKTIALPDEFSPDPSSSESEDRSDQQPPDCAACLLQAIGYGIRGSTPSVTSLGWIVLDQVPMSEQLSTRSLRFSTHPSRAPPEV